jgi:hypothetical protein
MQAEDPLLQACALSVMPLESLRQRAARTWALNQEDFQGDEDPQGQNSAVSGMLWENVVLVCGSTLLLGHA